MKAFILIAFFGLFAANTNAQYAPEADFKAEFQRHMAVMSEKPNLSFEQRDVLHTNIAGGILATIAIPVIVASTITFVTGGDDTNMAATGLAFGGIGLGGSFALHAIGIKKAVRYHKAQKNDALE